MVNRLEPIVSRVAGGATVIDVAPAAVFVVDDAAAEAPAHLGVHDHAAAALSC